MWNRKKSISLSKLCILVFMGLLVVTVGFAPWLVSWFMNYSVNAQKGGAACFLVTIYAGSLPVAYLLYNLLILLRRIEGEQIFIPKNVECLRRISWSCFIGAIMAFFSTFYYFPWLFVGVPAAFMGLIVRVVKNIVAQAVALQEEVDSII